MWCKATLIIIAILSRVILCLVHTMYTYVVYFSKVCADIHCVFQYHAQLHSLSQYFVKLHCLLQYYAHFECSLNPSKLDKYLSCVYLCFVRQWRTTQSLKERKKKKCKRLFFKGICRHPRKQISKVIDLVHWYFANVIVKQKQWASLIRYMWLYYAYYTRT